MKLIILFLAWLAVVIIGLRLLSSRLRHAKDKNEAIYENKTEAVKTHENKPGDIEIQESETVITYRDLMDEEERLDYGQMNY